MTDIERQLAASLPNEARRQDFARMLVARRDVELAIELLQRARAAIGATTSEHRPAVRMIDEAMLSARKGYADVEVIIRALTRSPL